MARIAGMAGVALASAMLGVLTVLRPGAAFGLVAVAAAVVALARPELVVPLLLVYLPLEDLILGWLPLSGTAFAAARLAGEAALYAAAVAVLGRRVLLGRRLERTPLDGPILLIILVAAASTVLNQSPLTGSLMNLRAVLRYAVLFYVIVNLAPDVGTIRRWVRLLFGVAGVQLAVAALQMVGGEPVRRFFWPRGGAVELWGQSKLYALLEKGGREIGSVFGTMSDTVLFAGFLVVVLTLYIGGRERMSATAAVVSGALLGAILWSYSRAAAFAGLLTLLLWYAYRRGWGRTAAWLGATAVVLVVGVGVQREYVEPERERQSVVQNLTGVFSSDYVDLARKQRLAAVLGNVPTVLANRPLLGYGPDQATTIDRLNASQRSFLLRTWDAAGFEDVYWAAILAYYGLAGVAAFVWLFVRVYSSARFLAGGADDTLACHLGRAVRILVPVTAFLLFFGQFLEYRTYAAYFWALVGMMLAAASPASIGGGDSSVEGEIATMARPQSRARGPS